ncbi:MAG: urease accessory protein UreD [Rhodobacteraceae bacterium]|nr:urease accessory protein UreD [Paracoccaceae bacterium]
MQMRQTLHQRSQGHAAVGFVLVNSRGRLRDLRQEGSAKAILPHSGGSEPEVVFLNTSGGLTSGDRLSYAADLGPGVRVTATTQTAERAYRAGEGAAQLDVRFRVGAGGWLDWLPQETILFEGARLDRRTGIELAEGAGCLMLETVVLGRAAMGETVTRTALNDLRCITRAGRPVFLEPLRLTDAALQAGPAVLDDARALASLVLVDEDAEDRLARVRALPGEPGCAVAASALPGRLVIRVSANEAYPLRRQIARLLCLLRDRPLPRVWQI